MMRRWRAILLAAMLMMTSGAQGAQWGEGRSAAQPYAGTPPLDLEKTMGYIMLYPRPKMPAQNFCDKLAIYLPREDVELSQGAVSVMKASGSGAAEEIARMEFTDGDSVKLREMTEREKESVLWGGGVCIEIQLPISLELKGSGYYVTMEAGCFTGQAGPVSSLPITDREAWELALEGEYGVSRLYYTEPEGEGDEEAGEADEDEEGAGAGAAPVYKTRPEAGDRIRFDLVMGGEAVYAVIYSENSSVFFKTIEYTESQAVEGIVTKDEINWGVVFLDGEGNMLKAVTINRQ